MEQVIELFGHGKNLTVLQMCCRGMLVFIITLLLIRISGRRSFGMRTPLDNIIILLLGAVLSRAIAGASPFWPAIATSFVIVILHRAVGRLMIQSKKLTQLIEGQKFLLFEKGKFLNKNMQKGIVCEADILQGLRKEALTEDLSLIDKIYMEASGEISVVKTKKD